MKKQNTVLCALILSLMSINFSANAAEDIDNVTMEISTKESKRGHRIHMPPREMILAHMIKNGEITVEEIEAYRTKRKTQRQELKALKQAGDIDAFKARLNEIKEEHKIKREELEEYFRNNDELKREIRERRNDRRERIKEELRDRRKEKKHILRDNMRNNIRNNKPQ